MTTIEVVRGSLQRAQGRTEGPIAWTEAARMMWLGYVAGLVQLGVLSADDAFVVVKEDLKATEQEREYMLRLLDTNLLAAENLRVTR